MIFSTPILEDDYWRYFWDGAVTANGLNPYQEAPQTFIDGLDGTAPQVPGFERLAREGHATLLRVNHPSLRTIYPPLAQAAFAAAHAISPWNLTAWRIVLLLCDLATMALLLRVLRLLNLPSGWSSVYWLNPLLINTGFNAVHMDLLVFPFVLASLLLALHRKYEWGVCVLACAAGVKVWPVLLIPFLLRPLVPSPRRLLLSIGAAISILMFLAWPILLSGLDPASGFTTYARRWEMNDAAFMALLAAIRWVSAQTGADAFAPLIARLLTAALVIVWVIRLAWRPALDGRALVRRMLSAVAALFLLSPTQFPWYSLWILPLLAIQPRLSLSLFTVLLPLYHLRFYFVERDLAAVFDFGVVWAEYLPVWILLAWEARGGCRIAEGRDP
jgi:hypothetical protein